MSQRFVNALDNFKRATRDLNAAWESADGDILGATYPGYLPSFDEFAFDVMGMQPQAELEVERHTVVVEVPIVNNTSPDDSITRALEAAGAKVVEYHHEQMTTTEEG
jgi:hypothetical protein